MTIYYIGLNYHDVINLMCPTLSERRTFYFFIETTFSGKILFVEIDYAFYISEYPYVDVPWIFQFMSYILMPSNHPAFKSTMPLKRRTCAAWAQYQAFYIVVLLNMLIILKQYRVIFGNI